MSTSPGPEAPPPTAHVDDTRLRAGGGAERGGTGLRRQARERAMHLLYEAEAKSQSPLEILRDLPVVPDAYALTLVEGVAAHQAEIDGLIAGHASGWELGRMPAVDRQLLRLATYELLAEPEVPAAVVIDEAVELAKQYSTEESGRYVNGVLAAIGRRLGRLAGPAAPGATAAGHLAEQAGPRPGAGGRAGGEGLPRPGTVGGVRAVPGR